MRAQRYQEWLAPAALRGSVICLWSSVALDDTETLVLPDACSDLIWERGRGVYVAGPDTGPNPAPSPAGMARFGVRFRPGAGGPALGLPLSELRDQRVDLADLRPALVRGLPGTLDLETAMSRVLDVAGHLVADNPPDIAMTHASRMLADQTAQVADVAVEIGLSPRQFRRRFHDTVGYGPKTLQRILRFRRFLSRIDSGDADLAAIAVDVGYADQAHLTRECADMAGLTPAVLARLRGAG